MNTVIFITKQNKEEMAQSIQRLAARQPTRVNGALIVCHQSAVSAKEVERIARPLIDKFVTGAAVKAASNMQMSHDGQIAVMLARFVALAYARYPGPWLVIDSPCEANVDGWAEAAVKQHLLHGGKVSGCATRDGKTLLTHGPLTIQLQLKTMRMLHFSTNESWRSRGRYLLMNSGLREVAPEASLFRPLNECYAKRLTPAQFEQLKTGVAKLHTPDAEPAPPVAAVFEGAEKVELLNLIEKATGKRPHHFTGLDKLREIVQQLNEQPPSA